MKYATIRTHDSDEIHTIPVETGYHGAAGWRVVFAEFNQLVSVKHVCRTNHYPVDASLDVPIDGPAVCRCPGCGATATREDLGLRPYRSGGTK